MYSVLVYINTIYLTYAATVFYTVLPSFSISFCNRLVESLSIAYNFFRSTCTREASLNMYIHLREPNW